MAAASPIPVSDDAVVSPALASAPSLVDVLIAPDAVPTFLARANPEQMRIVAYEMETDAGLAARLLRARKGDVEKALTLLGEIAKWRVDMGVRELALTANAYDLLGGVVLDELQPFHSKTYWPYPDKQGRPIYLERTGSCDPSMMQSLVDLDKLERHHIYTQETDVRGLCALASKAAGRAIVATTSILDMNGISMKVAGAEARAFVKRCSAIDSANYPETLGTMLIINAPGIFTAIWSMVKGFLDERTVAKIQILGGPSSWMPKLEELVDKDKIPEEYGGTLKIPGGLFKPSRTNKVQLSAGKDHTVEVPITEAGGKTIRFKWMCKPAGE
jgi:CRAL/TRIO domain